MASRQTSTAARYSSRYRRQEDSSDREHPVVIPAGVGSSSDFDSVMTTWISYNQVPVTAGLINSVLSGADLGQARDQAALINTILEKDTAIASHIQTRTLTVLAAKWSVSGKNKGDDIKATAVQDMLNKARMNDNMRHLLNALPTGYAGSIIDWAMGGSEIRGFLPVHPVNWNFDQEGNPAFVNEDGVERGLNEYHKYQFVFHKHMTKPGIPTTGGLCRLLVWLFFFSHYAMKHRARFLEKFGIPIMVAKISESDFANEDVRSKVKAAVRGIGADGVGVLTNNAEINTLTAAGQAKNAEFGDWLAYLDNLKTIAILGQLASSDKATGMSNGQIQNNVRQDIFAADCRNLEETIQTQIIEPLEWYRYRSSSLKFKIEYEPQGNIEQKLNTLKALKQAGFKPRAKWVEDTLGVPLESDDVEEALDAGVAPDSAIQPQPAAEQPVSTAGAPPAGDQTAGMPEGIAALLGGGGDAGATPMSDLRADKKKAHLKAFSDTATDLVVDASGLPDDVKERVKRAVDPLSEIDAIISDPETDPAVASAVSALVPSIEKARADAQAIVDKQFEAPAAEPAAPTEPVAEEPEAATEPPPPAIADTPPQSAEEFSLKPQPRQAPAEPDEHDDQMAISERIGRLRSRMASTNDPEAKKDLMRQYEEARAGTADQARIMNAVDSIQDKIVDAASKIKNRADLTEDGIAAIVDAAVSGTRGGEELVDSVEGMDARLRELAGRMGETAVQMEEGRAQADRYFQASKTLTPEETAQQLADTLDKMPSDAAKRAFRAEVGAMWEAEGEKVAAEDNKSGTLYKLGRSAWDPVINSLAATGEAARGMISGPGRMDKGGFKDPYAMANLGYELEVLERKAEDETNELGAPTKETLDKLAEAKDKVYEGQKWNENKAFMENMEASSEVWRSEAERVKGDGKLSDFVYSSISALAPLGVTVATSALLPQSTLLRVPGALKAAQALYGGKRVKDAALAAEKLSPVANGIISSLPFAVDTYNGVKNNLIMNGVDGDDAKTIAFGSAAASTVLQGVSASIFNSSFRAADKTVNDSLVSFVKRYGENALTMGADTFQQQVVAPYAADLAGGVKELPGWSDVELENRSADVYLKNWASTVPHTLLTIGMMEGTMAGARNALPITALALGKSVKAASDMRRALDKVGDAGIRESLKAKFDRIDNTVIRAAFDAFAERGARMGFTPERIAEIATAPEAERDALIQRSEAEFKPPENTTLQEVAETMSKALSLAAGKLFPDAKTATAYSLFGGRKASKDLQIAKAASLAEEGFAADEIAMLHHMPKEMADRYIEEQLPYLRKPFEGAAAKVAQDAVALSRMPASDRRLAGMDAESDVKPTSIDPATGAPSHIDGETVPPEASLAMRNILRMQARRATVDLSGDEGMLKDYSNAKSAGRAGFADKVNETLGTTRDAPDLAEFGLMVIADKEPIGNGQTRTRYVVTKDIANTKNKWYDHVGRGYESVAMKSKDGKFLYKFYGPDESGGYGAEMNLKDLGDQLSYDVASGSIGSLVEKLHVLSDIGGAPSEILGMTPEGILVVKAPIGKALAESKTGVNPLLKARAHDTTHMWGGAAVEGIRSGVTFVDGQPYWITDVRDPNILADSKGEPRMIDIVAQRIPDEVMNNADALGAIVLAYQKLNKTPDPRMGFIRGFASFREGSSGDGPGVTRAQVAKRLLSMLKRFDPGEVEIVDKQNDLPPELLRHIAKVERDTGKTDMRIRGARMSDGKVFIVAENHATIADAAKTILHEIGLHQGIVQTLGGDVEKFLRATVRTNKKVRDAIAKKREEYGSDKVISDERVAEEVIAEWAEAGDFPLLVRRFAAAIKSVFRKLVGKDGGEISDTDVLELIRMARKKAMGEEGASAELSNAKQPAIGESTLEKSQKDDIVRARRIKQNISSGVYNADKLHERVAQEALREDDGRRIIYAEDVARGGLQNLRREPQEFSAGPDVYSNIEKRNQLKETLRSVEAAALRGWADDNGLLLSDREFNQKRAAAGKHGGAESDVYHDEVSGRWFKRNNLAYNLDYADYLNRLALHNYYFPEAPYRLEGFVDHDGVLMPIVSQPDRSGKKPTRAQIHEKMIDAGFTEKYADDGTFLGYEDKSTGVFIDDIHPRNASRVKGKDGKFHTVVFDPVITLDPDTKTERLREWADSKLKESHSKLSIDESVPSRKIEEPVESPASNPLTAADIPEGLPVEVDAFSPDRMSIVADKVPDARAEWTSLNDRLDLLKSFLKCLET